jgi:cytoskeletal protein CcmA (bactofilin family)
VCPATKEFPLFIANIDKSIIAQALIETGFVTGSRLLCSDPKLFNRRSLKTGLSATSIELADNATLRGVRFHETSELPVIRQRQYMNRGFEQLSANLYSPVFYTLYGCHDLSSRS